MPYINPGYAATQAIESFLVQRDEEQERERQRQRQTQQDSLAMRRETRIEQDADEERQLRRKTNEDAAFQQGYTRTEKRINEMVPGDRPDAELLADAKKYGLAHRFAEKVKPIRLSPWQTTPIPESRETVNVGTDEQREIIRKRDAQQGMLDTLPVDSPERKRAEYAQIMGHEAPNAGIYKLASDPNVSDPNVKEIGGYFWTRQADGTWLKGEKTRDVPRSSRASGGATTSSNMQPEYANALDRAILNMPGTRRAGVVDLANRLWASGNTEELKQVIKQAAVETEPTAAVRAQVQGRNNALAAIRDIRITLKDLKDAGIDTNLLTGTAEVVARQLGKSTDTRLVAAGTRIQDAYIEYRKSLTGVAFGIQEAKDYEKLFPNFSNELPINEAILAGLERGMGTRDRLYWESKLGPDGARLVGALPSEESASTSETAAPKPTVADLRKKYGRKP